MGGWAWRALSRLKRVDHLFGGGCGLVGFGGYGDLALTHRLDVLFEGIVQHLFRRRLLSGRLLSLVARFVHGALLLDYGHVTLAAEERRTGHQIVRLIARCRTSPSWLLLQILDRLFHR